MNTKVVMFVFGTRPEAIKMAPVILELKKHSDMLVPLIVLTGQHKEMLEQVMKVFNLKEDYNLDIMAESQSLSQITTKTIQGLEGVIFREKPDLIVVQGDTSTAFAAGLCAVRPAHDLQPTRPATSALSAVLYSICDCMARGYLSRRLSLS